jgi:hypothetical protein
MEVRMLIPSDYDAILSPWWESWNWTAPAKDMLPEDGSGGVIVSKNGENICAGFLYFTNSKTAWLEYVVSNKEYRDNDRREAIEFLINCLTSIANDKGYKYIYTSLKSAPLVLRYEACGFIKGDAKCQEMIKIL